VVYATANNVSGAILRPIFSVEIIAFRRIGVTTCVKIAVITVVSVAFDFPPTRHILVEGGPLRANS
jgi:hypothetical protein